MGTTNFRQLPTPDDRTLRTDRTTQHLASIDRTTDATCPATKFALLTSSALWAGATQEKSRTTFSLLLSMPAVEAAIKSLSILRWLPTYCGPLALFSSFLMLTYNACLSSMRPSCRDMGWLLSRGRTSSCTKVESVNLVLAPQWLGAGHISTMVALSHHQTVTLTAPLEIRSARSHRWQGFRT